MNDEILEEWDDIESAEEIEEYDVEASQRAAYLAMANIMEHQEVHTNCKKISAEESPTGEAFDPDALCNVARKCMARLFRTMAGEKVTSEDEENFSKSNDDLSD